MKYALSVLTMTMTMALSSGAAFAAPGDVLGPGRLAEVIVPFTEPSGLGHSLTAESNLEAKNYPAITKIASGVVTVTEGPALERVSVRWVNGSPIPGLVGPDFRTISGSNPAHSINLYLSYPDDDSNRAEANAETDSVDLTSPTSSPMTVFKYQLNLRAGQNVAADSYKIQINAHKFNS